MRFLVRTLTPLLPLLAFLACSDDSPNDTADGGGGDGGRTNAEQLVLPFVVSQQGTLQSDGQEQRRGALVAVQQLNSLGGILGRQVRLEYLEDNSDPAAAAGLASRLAELAAPVVIGPTGSPAAATLRAAAPNQVFVSASATSPVLDTVAGDAGVAASTIFFRTAASDTLLAKGLTLLLSGGEISVDGGADGCQSLAIVNSDDDYGRPIADRVAQLLGLTTTQVTKRIPIQGTLAQPEYYAGVANSVLQSEQRCQLVIAPAEIGANYVRSFRQALTTAGKDWASFQTFGSNALRTDAFLKNSLEDPAIPTSTNLADGVRMVAANTQGDLLNFSPFRTLFESQFPGVGPGLSANAYDAVIVTALAMEAAGAGADGPAVTEALLRVSKLGTAYGPKNVGDAIAAIRRGEDVDYVGASGSLDFDNKGQVLSDFLVWRVDSGKFVNTSRFTQSDVQQ